MGSGEQAFSDGVKATIIRRQKGRCARCGLPVQRGHFHHRKPRRMGGGSDPRVGHACNGLLLHPKCHDWVESNRLQAVRLGFLLSATEQPDEVPVRTWEGWRLLVGAKSTPVDPSVMGENDRVGYIRAVDAPEGGEPVLGGVAVGPPVDVVGLASGDVSEVEP